MSARKVKSPDDEEAGIQAIMFLQGMVGIVTTRQEAKIGWLQMSPDDQEETLEAHRQIIKLTDKGQT